MTGNSASRLLAGRVEDVEDDPRDLLRQEWRDGVPDLPVLRGPRPAKIVVVREGLDARGFAHRHAATLCRVVMEVVVTIFRDVTSNRGCRTMRDLDTEAI